MPESAAPQPTSFRVPRHAALIREHGGEPSSHLVDALLDERKELTAN
jgi:hypothetical protein